MKTHRCKNANGSITIFLALSLTLIFSVIFSTLTFSRRIALSSYLEGITHIGMDSIFSGYCVQLWEDYNVFATITNESDLERYLKMYISTNIQNASFLKAKLSDIDICEVTNLTGNSGEAFIEQVLNYMQYKEITQMADYLFASSNIDYDPSNLSELADGDLSAEAFESLDFGSLFEMVENSNDTFTVENFETDMTLSDTFSLDSLESITHIFDDMLIYYLVESPDLLSTKDIVPLGLPSYYLQEHVDTGVKSYNTFEKFLFCEYLTTHFSSYTTTVKEFSPDYQLEYILCGYYDEKDNLTETARAMVLLRFGFNVIHILTDSTKMNTLKSIASVTSIIPALPIVIQILLICLWALAESVIDVRDLLAGKGIPLFKTADDWSLSLDNILTFDFETESKSKEGNGLTYNNYLEMLLMNTNTHAMAVRALDLIQLDFSTSINETFSIINCMVGASCDFKYNADDIFSSVNFYNKSYLKPSYIITHNYYYR